MNVLQWKWGRHYLNIQMAAQNGSGAKLKQAKMFSFRGGGIQRALHRKANYGNSAEVNWWHRSGSPGDAAGLNIEGDKVGFMEIKRQKLRFCPLFVLPWLKIAKILRAVNPKTPRVKIWRNQNTRTTLKPDYNLKEDSRVWLDRPNWPILIFF